MVKGVIDTFGNNNVTLFVAEIGNVVMKQT